MKGMKKTRQISAPIVFIFFSIFLFVCGAAPAGELITIEGRIYIETMDEVDTVTAVYIETKDEEIYVVENDQTGKQLVRLLGSEIVITGTVKTDKNGKKTITVREFKVPGS